MLLQKTLLNLVAAGIAPIVLLIRWLPNVFDALFYQQYRYYDFQVETLGEFLYLVYGETYVLFFILSLTLLFLPFQFIKDFYRKNGESRMLTFPRKWVLLTLIFLGWVLFSGSFLNVWWHPLYKNLIYIVYARGFSLIFTTFFHYTLDRYENRKV